MVIQHACQAVSWGADPSQPISTVDDDQRNATQNIPSAEKRKTLLVGM